VCVQRSATASARVLLGEEAFTQVLQNQNKKVRPRSFCAGGTTFIRHTRQLSRFYVPGELERRAARTEDGFRNCRNKFSRGPRRPKRFFSSLVFDTVATALYQLGSGRDSLWTDTVAYEVREESNSS
jgi:hypothetical protein